MATISVNPALAAHAAPSTIREEGLVESSFLQKIKYDSTTLQLTVTMKNGAEYVHFYVFPMTVDQLMQSPSKGSFYATQIKGKNPGTRLIDKNVGKAVRPLAKGPIHQENKRRTHGRQ